MLSLFYLCRLNPGRQEQAAAYGIVPFLQEAIRERSPVRQFALPLLCDLAAAAGAGPKVRMHLRKHKSAEFLVTLLNPPERVAAAPGSHTGRFLAATLGMEHLLEEK